MSSSEEGKFTLALFQEPEFREYEGVFSPTQKKNVVKALNACSAFFPLIQQMKARKYRESVGPNEKPRMTWGKHKGMLISDVPLSYLQWVVHGSNSIPGSCKEFIIKYRPDASVAPPKRKAKYSIAKEGAYHKG